MQKLSPGLALLLPSGGLHLLIWLLLIVRNQLSVNSNCFFKFNLFFTSSNYIAKAMVYAITRALKRQPYNSDHRGILANREERIVKEQSEVIFDKKMSLFEWRRQFRLSRNVKKQKKLWKILEMFLKKEFTIDHEFSSGYISPSRPSAEKFKDRKDIRQKKTPSSYYVTYHANHWAVERSYSFSINIEAF